MLGDVARFGPFELDLQTHELSKYGIRVKLQEQPFQILAALIVADGQLVTISELKQKLWPEGVHVDFQQGILRAINKLRTALGDSAAKAIYVETVNRSGYRFLAPVVWPEKQQPGKVDVTPKETKPSQVAQLQDFVPIHRYITKVRRPAIALALMSALVTAVGRARTRPQS